MIFLTRILFVLFCILVLFTLVSTNDEGIKYEFSPSSLDISVDAKHNVTVTRSNVSSTVLFVFTYHDSDHGKVAQLSTEIIKNLPEIRLSANQTTYNIEVIAKKAGKVFISVNDTKSGQNLVVKVHKSKAWKTISSIVGWIYFFTWSISFYPQIFSNWKRKSVQGLNFDFLAYNITGFLAYGIFNVGMFWSKHIQMEYATLHPFGVNPVQLNDVVFTLHAIVATVITIGQCFVYESGGQRVSRVGIITLVCMWFASLVFIFFVIAKHFSWLSYLYYFSYLKILITIIKYLPQAYMNYRRKSTLGWSIGNVLLDFTGGLFSILQMIIIGYNNNDMSSIFGDPTKFGLGFFSMLFDVLFMVQHYGFYRNSRLYDLLPSAD